MSVALGLLITLGLVPLHLEFHRHAGPLWRDEVNSVNVATLPSFIDVFRHSHLDSFPVVFVTALHAWTIVGLGESDTQLRQFGLLVGLATLAALWWSGRHLHLDAPLATLLLFGLSPTVIIYGDAVRGYGLGALCVALSIGAMWAFVEHPAPRTFLVAQLAALLAVQTYYANCFLLLALCAGAAAVCARRQAPRTLAAVTAIGAVAAVSLLIDLDGFVYALQVAPIEQGDWSSGWLLSIFRQALAPETPALDVLWALAPVLAAAGCALVWWAPSGGNAEVEKDRALYVAVATPLGFVSYFFYLKYVAKLPTQFWYYLSLMVLIALACDVGIALLSQRLRLGPWARLSATALIAVLATGNVLATVRVRMTNLDIIAAQLARDAQPNDLIVVIPWHCGITFQRYYRGRAPWMTLPDFQEHQFHGHLLVKEKMKLGDAGIAAEMTRIAATLGGGGRVWIVGAPHAPPPGQTAPSLPPAPTGPQGWRAGPYRSGWELQMGALLQDHGRDISNITLPDVGRVNAWETLPLILVRGWQ